MNHQLNHLVEVFFYCPDRLESMLMFLHCFSLAGTNNRPNIFEMFNNLRMDIQIWEDIVSIQAHLLALQQRCENEEILKE